VFPDEAISAYLKGDCFGRKCAALAMTCDIDKINRPSRLRRAIGFDLSYSSTSKASPNDTEIVIIIIIIGEVVDFEHCGAIIAQSYLFGKLKPTVCNK
jgi:hypothetical protein